MSKSAKDKPSGTRPASETKPSGAGYGQPPAHTRFQKGKSGNPGGRPKGSKNLRTLICELADEQVTLITPDGKKQVTVREAVARKHLEMMLKGDFRFFKAFHELEQLWEADLRLDASRAGEREVEYLQAMIKSIFGIGEESVGEPLPDEDESD